MTANEWLSAVWVRRTGGPCMQPSAVPRTCRLTGYSRVRRPRRGGQLRIASVMKGRTLRRLACSTPSNGACRSVLSLLPPRVSRAPFLPMLGAVGIWGLRGGVVWIVEDSRGMDEEWVSEMLEHACSGARGRVPMSPFPRSLRVTHREASCALRQIAPQTSWGPRNPPPNNSPPLRHLQCYKLLLPSV